MYMLQYKVLFANGDEVSNSTYPWQKEVENLALDYSYHFSNDMIVIEQTLNPDNRQVEKTRVMAVCRKGIFLYRDSGS
jgi:hypothetical protein